MKKCWMCDKFMFFKAGDVEVVGSDYTIKEAVCSDCYKLLEKEHEIQEIRYDGGDSE